jgi:hypothetical protein
MSLVADVLFDSMNARACGYGQRCASSRLSRSRSQRRLGEFAADAISERCEIVLLSEIGLGPFLPRTTLHCALQIVGNAQLSSAAGTQAGARKATSLRSDCLNAELLASFLS